MKSENNKIGNGISIALLPMTTTLKNELILSCTTAEATADNCFDKKFEI
jgi:hypothetical protein